MPTRSNSVELFIKKISDYMSADDIYVYVNASISETIKDLQQQKKSTILIKKDNKLVGIITEQDIVRKVTFISDSGKKVSDFMTSPVIFVYEDDLLFHAVGKMRKNNLRHLPVINMNSEVVGIIYADKALAAELGAVTQEIDKMTFDEYDERGLIQIKKQQVHLAARLLDEKTSSNDISYCLLYTSPSPRDS